MEKRNICKTAGCFSGFRSILGYIHYDSKVAELIGLDLYTFIEKNKEQMKNRPLSRDIVFIYNKITTVSDLFLNNWELEK